MKKAPQLGREFPWKWNHSSPSLAFNPAGIGIEKALFASMSSTVRSRQPDRPLLCSPVLHTFATPFLLVERVSLIVRSPTALGKRFCASIEGKFLKRALQFIFFLCIDARSCPFFFRSSRHVIAPHARILASGAAFLIKDVSHP